MINQIRNSAFLKNVSIVFLSNILNKGISFLIIYLISRKLSVENYGTLTVLLSLMYSVADFANLGLNGSITRYTAIFQSENNVDKINRLISTVLTNIISFGLVLFLFITIFSVQVSHLLLKQDVSFLVIVVSFGIIPMLVFSSIDALFQGLQSFSNSFKYMFISNISRLLLIVLILHLYPNNTLFIILTFIIPPLLAIIIAYFFLIKNIKYSIYLYDYTLLKEIMGFSKWISLYLIIYVILSKLDIFLLSSLCDTKQVAYFDIAQKIISLLMVFMSAYGTVLTPKLSSIKNLILIKTEMKKSFWFCGIMSVGLIISIFVFPFVLSFMFQNKYDNSIILIQIMVCGLIPHVWTYPFNASLYAVGKSKVFFYIIIVQLILNLVSSVILLPRLGAIGAAVSFCIVNSAAIIISYFFYKYYFKLAELIPNS